MYILFHMWEKSATSLFRNGLINLLNVYSPHDIGMVRTYSVSLEDNFYSDEVFQFIKNKIKEDINTRRHLNDFSLKGFHIIHLRDFRDMLISNYWNTWTHPECLAIKNQKAIIANCKDVNEYALYKRDSVAYTGYSVDFFNEVLIKEYNYLLKYIQDNGMEEIKFVYYEDMVADFKNYLCQIQPIFGLNDTDVDAIYTHLNKTIVPDGGFKRKVFPGAYKDELNKDLSNYFVEAYKKYPFLHRYIEEL